MLSGFLSSTLLLTYVAWLWVCMDLGSFIPSCITVTLFKFHQKICLHFIFQEEEMETFKADAMKEAKMDAELKELKKENEELREYILQLQGEVYGARLAAKYLDKELAGRYFSVILIHLTRLPLSPWSSPPSFSCPFSFSLPHPLALSPYLSHYDDCILLC